VRTIRWGFRKTFGFARHEAGWDLGLSYAIATVHRMDLLTSNGVRIPLAG